MPGPSKRGASPNKNKGGNFLKKKTPPLAVVESLTAREFDMVRGSMGPTLLLLTVALVSASAPTGLLCEFQKSPALGIRATPHFSWIVPPCAAGSDHQQHSYQITISMLGVKQWDSGQVVSSDSTYAAIGDPTLLKPGTPYSWTVTTWTTPKGGGTPCKSAPSAPATFITALFDGWDNAGVPSQGNATFINLAGKPKATFGYFRKEFTIPAGVTHASAFVTAPNSDPLLCGYKFFINGKLANLGPGRGEAPVWEGDGVFRHLPYTTLDVTSQFSTPGNVTVALQTMQPGSTPSAIMMLKLHLAGGKTMTVVTDGSWQAFNGDAHRKPGPATHGHSAGTGCVVNSSSRV
jgi:hypothetical protein